MTPRLFTKLRRHFIVSAPVKYIIRRSKHLRIPGFRGIPLFDVSRFFMQNARKVGFTERASAISFNLTMAIPPAVIFLFTLIPYLPISRGLINQLFSLIRDVVPGKENNEGIIGFLLDILNKPRTGLLSTGFILAMFFSSNAVMGIMRSFDKNYVGFKRQRGLKRRGQALRLTFILFLLFIVTMGALIAQGQVLRWLGIENATLISIIHNFRWLLIVLMIFLGISFIYRFATSMHKKWRLLNPGSVFATALMILFTGAFSYYVSNFSNYNELYGSISTILVLMLLIYFNSLVLLIGFELNVSINSLRHEVDERNKNTGPGVVSS
ncbi:MAG: YihY/virulence factor BrkB family protein [Chitinophagaceae bacterium]|nr:MAG: YihY/virulence factor BrkB family protein [Chitinophagaceae bacterium]